MKNTVKNPFTILCALVASLGLMATVPPGAEAQTKSKEKPKTTASSSKSKAKSAASKSKSKSKSKEKADDGDAAEAAQLKKATEMLKVLSSSKKASLTKLANSGKQEDLEALPGVGEVTAKAIIKARPLKSTAHLILVKGIGEKTFQQIVDSRK